MANQMLRALMDEEKRGTLANPGIASPLGPTLSMKTGAFLHPLLQAAKDKFPKDNPRGRWLGEMLLGDSPQRTGRVAEGVPDQYFHYNRGSGSNVSPEIVDLAGALPIASTLKLAKAAAVPAAMATGAAALNRLKAPGYAATSMDDIGAALLGQSLQNTGRLDDAMVTYQGSPHKFDALDPTKIGTGEGAQAFGHGLYVAQDPRVGGGYRDDAVQNAYLNNDKNYARALDSGLSSGEFDAFESRVRRQGVGATPENLADEFFATNKDWAPLKNNPEEYENIRKFSEDYLTGLPEGYLYEIDVPDEDIAKMLDWDAPLSEQPWFRDVKELAAEYKKDGKPADNYAKMIARANARGDVTGKQFYEGMTGAPAERSAFLERAGIPGIKYYDQGSRAAGEGTRNMVLFDDLARRAKVLKRNDEAIAEPSVDEFIGKFLDDELPLDEASRMQRAREMGFDVDNPLYHATNDDFSEFDLSLAGRNTNEYASSPEMAETSRLGVWVNSHPLGQSPDKYGAGYGIDMPLYATKGKYYEIDNLTDLENLIRQGDGSAEAVKARLIDKGYDGIKVLKDEEFGNVSTVIFDPTKLRSKFAKFDPAKKDSAKLLAGAAGAGVLSGLYEPDALKDDEKMRRALLRN